MYDNYFLKMLYEKRDCDNSNSKYEIYCQVKRQYRMEKYLHYLNDKQLRKNIIGVRCASNILPINHLRKYNIKKKLRFCRTCKDTIIGTEKHIFMECTNALIVKLRDEFLNKIYSKSPQLILLNSEQMLFYLVQTVEQEITTLVAMYIGKFFKIVKKITMYNIKKIADRIYVEARYFILHIYGTSRCGVAWV